MKHPAPAPALQIIQRYSPIELSGKRIALLGSNTYVKSLFRRLIVKPSTSIQEEIVEPVDQRESTLRIRDSLQTTPFQWELPLIWIESAEHIFQSMSFPEDFPTSKHIVVCCCGTDEIYIPPSFMPVSIGIKGAGAPVQEVIRWVMGYKGITAEIDVIRFLAGEYKENLPGLDKLIDQLFLTIHPRTTIMMKDLETEISLEWDCEVIIQSILESDEGRVLKELHQALKTFHPKGIVTVLSRRVQMLIQVATSIAVSGGQPEIGGDIRPWVWRNNLELVKSIPLPRLFKWAVALDKAYSQLSRGSISHRWTLTTMMMEMTRV